MRVALYRIGTAARLSGLPIVTLRNWEQRCGAVVPTRSASGQRLYTLDDIEHLRMLKAALDAGLSAGEAHADLVRQLREDATGLRIGDGTAVREQERRLRVAVAETHAGTAAQHERAARHLIALAERTQGAAGDGFRELARKAEGRAARTRALADEARIRSGPAERAPVYELRRAAG